MDSLADEEQLVVSVAKATCFTYRVDPASVPRPDVDLYVDELVRLHSSKPSARVASRSGESTSELRGVLEFCLEQLAEASPTNAERLRRALVR
jgi:hypothetical protein